MAKRFEFHLQGMAAPEGLIDADRLVDIVKSLQEMATRLGRIETESAHVGRPSKNLERVASLRIGLNKGSTTIIAERSTQQGLFDLDLPDEQAADERLCELFECIGSDQRPNWVTDSVASTAGDLVAGLQRTAPWVELKVDGVSVTTFEPLKLHREVWKPRDFVPGEIEVTFSGRLFAVNLNTHHLQVQDDVGNKVALPKVANDTAVRHLIGSYVTVTGMPQFDDQGRIAAIREADIVKMESPLDGGQLPDSASVERIVANAPGLDPGGLDGLTDEEADAFFEAMGL